MRFHEVETSTASIHLQTVRNMALELNEDTFDGEVLESSTPVLVDFWAPT